ncbi:MAG TPA: hypothetical protein VM260_12005 [Pirellula sp.]|nr:hypothetical protein [Pirellula sp.]
MRLQLLQTLRYSLSFGIAVFGGAFWELLFVSECVAQQPPTWSPQPFSKPNAIVATPSPSDVPPNSLRPTDRQQNGDVLRWGISNKELRHSRDDKSSGPRTGFELSNNRVDRVSSVQVASHNEVSVSVPRQDQRTSGVWYDRTSGKNGDSRPVSSGSVSGRHAESNMASQNARFQDQQVELPPVENPMPSKAPDSMLDSNSSRALNDVLEMVPPTSQPQQNKPGRSLLEPEPLPPKPLFPGSKSPKPDNVGRSPSDTDEPPSMKDSDAAPAPPRRLDRSVVDCDSVRLLAKESDITKIRIDSSPSFVEGYKNKNRSAANTKEGFIESAPIRPWLTYDGQLVAEGKLVDLKLGSVIIERANGTRTSYLLHKLSDADQVYVSEKWGLPVTCSIDDRSFPRRDFVDTTVTWKASSACHKPLYFEDVQLERYGHEWGPFAQPVISTAHFFGDVLVLPYKMGIHPMNECQYSLGYYRPGSCAPWTIGPVPVSLRGALLQAKVVTGAALVLP